MVNIIEFCLLLIANEMFIKSLYTPGRVGYYYMVDVTIENIVAHAQIADKVEIEDIAQKISEVTYDPEKFSGLTFKMEKPKTAILLLPNGKAICTGAKKIEEVEEALDLFIDKIESVDVKVKKEIDIEIQNFVVSTNVNKELHLSSISKGLLLEKADYEPSTFPGLIYRMEDIGAILLIFSSGKIVCTGTKDFKEASKAIEIMKEKLSSLGAL